MITALPGWRVLALPVTIPRSIAPIAPSDSISVWIPRSRTPSSDAHTASGMPPIPICRVAPSSISARTWAPIWRSTSVAGWGVSSGRGSVASTTASTRPTWRNESPSTRGIASLTWAITRPAFLQAARVARVSTPRLMKPCSSGGETITSAASSGMIRSSNRRGIWWRKIGT